MSAGWPGQGWPAQPPDPEPGGVPPESNWAETQPAPGAGLDHQRPSEPVLVTIGDISVTQSRVYTPSGSRALSEVSWSLADMSVTSQSIPAWAVVCAIIFFLFCLLGLLFLLIKETTTQGSVQVSVHGPGFVHTTQIPVTSPAQIADINARIQHARMLTAAYTSVLPGQPQPGQPQPGQQPPGPAAGNPGQEPTQTW